MSAALDRLLLALEHATAVVPRKSGGGYRAACPACHSRSLKVSVGEGDDGRVLLHAFCGHTPGDVLTALHMEAADLFDRRDLRTMTADQRRALRDAMHISQWRAALPVLTEESHVVLIAGRQLADGFPLNPTDLDRVRVAVDRLCDAREVLTHG